MLCPEGEQMQNENLDDTEIEETRVKDKKLPPEGPGSLERKSYKNPKTWKKSITNFFRNQLRATKSNEGDRPTDNNNHYDENEIHNEQKWQSLGKMFRRQSFAENWNKSPNQPGEGSSHKRLNVRKVLSTYFGKHETSYENEK